VDVCVVVTLPPFFDTVSMVFASMRFLATVSASGLFPFTGLSFPS